MRAFEGLRAETFGLFGELSDIARARAAEEAMQRLEAGQQRRSANSYSSWSAASSNAASPACSMRCWRSRTCSPWDSFYATCLITTAGYAAEESISVTVAGADGELRQHEIGRHEIAAYATEDGNPGNAKQVQLITIQTPNSRLAPGLPRRHARDRRYLRGAQRRVTLGFLQSASALVLVTDATRPCWRVSSTSSAGRRNRRELPMTPTGLSTR